MTVDMERDYVAEARRSTGKAARASALLAGIQTAKRGQRLSDNPFGDKRLRESWASGYEMGVNPKGAKRRPPPRRRPAAKLTGGLLHAHFSHPEDC